MVDKLKIHSEMVTVRECSQCFARWPNDWDYCQNCAVWLPGNEREEHITTIVPWSGAAGGAPRLRLGTTLLAIELRDGYNSPACIELARGQELLKRLLVSIGVHGGKAGQIAKRGIVGYWKGRGGGTAQAARALCALAGRNKSLGYTERAMRVSADAVSLGVGVVLVDKVLADPRDRAFRLAALAHPNRVFFAREAYEQVVEEFDFQGLQPIVPKSEYLEPVFELIGPKPERSGTHHVGPDKVPMVGRRKLLQTIERCSHEAANGKCIVVHLVAEPGQGKSKLIREWLAERDRPDRLEGWIRLSCSGVPYGDYAFRSWQRLVAPLVRGGHADAEAQIIGAQAVAHKLRAAEQPVLLVIDDLHWIDAGSQNLIVRLISRLRETLVILAYRPSFVSKVRLEPPAVHRRYRIAPLSGKEMNTLIKMLAEESGAKLPYESSPHIVAKAHGSPLYAREAVAHLAEVGGAGRGSALPPLLIELLILRTQWTARELLPELERRRRDYQFGGTDKEELLHEVESLEERLCAWLDRFDLVEEESAKTVRKFLEGLQRVDGRLAILGILLGRQRPHRNRLAQALTRVQSFIESAGSTVEPNEDRRIRLP